MIDLRINKEGLAHNIQKAKENNIIIPTIAQMQNPDLIPEKIKEKLTHTGLWDVDPVNLFRISWHNEAKETGTAGGERRRQQCQRDENGQRQMQRHLPRRTVLCLLHGAHRFTGTGVLSDLPDPLP